MNGVAIISQRFERGRNRLKVEVSSMDADTIKTLTTRVLLALGPGIRVVRDEQTMQDTEKMERTRTDEQG
jgi:hypothetical protein